MYPKTFTKYGNVKTKLDNIVFASKREANRYAELVLLQKGRMITDLILQPEFILLEAFTDSMGDKHRPIIYMADFMYQDRNKKLIVEDVKGVRTRHYNDKKKLFLFKFPQYIFLETWKKH